MSSTRTWRTSRSPASRQSMPPAMRRATSSSGIARPTCCRVPRAAITSGGGGADTLRGGAGDDTYIVDQSGDVVSELAGEGRDTVKSSTSYTLGANVENLVLTGSAAGKLLGNGLENSITGNSAGDFLSGGPGNDRLMGGRGADS